MAERSSQQPFITAAARAAEYREAEQRRWQRRSAVRHPLVGIGGAYGAGKDALADILQRLGSYERSWISEPLHAALKIQNPWIRLDVPVRISGAAGAEVGSFMKYRELEELVGYSAMKQQREVREILQLTGTNMGRNFLGPDTWTKKSAEKIDSWSGAGIMTGIRYQNEADLILRRGGLLVWITRPAGVQRDSEALQPTLPGLERVVTALDTALGRDHESEHALKPSDFHLTIHNNGDLNDLWGPAGVVHALAAGTDAQRIIWRMQRDKPEVWAKGATTTVG